MTTSGEAKRRVGLARVLSKLGYCSRARAFALIRAGRVSVNGRVRRDPEMPVPEGARLEVDSEPVAVSAKVYLMMNKPRGLVATASDEKERATVYSLLAPGMPWVAPVGRLDQASEGLLLFTNDSEWGARLASPESHVHKTYHVQVSTVADDELLAKLRAGVRDGKDILRVQRGAVLRRGEKNSWLEITLDEGKNRHIRRMLAALNIDVLRLVRVSIGGVELGRLPKGKVRSLTDAEIQRLKHAAAARSSAASPGANC